LLGTAARIRLARLKEASADDRLLLRLVPSASPSIAALLHTSEHDGMQRSPSLFAIALLLASCGDGSSGQTSESTTTGTGGSPTGTGGTTGSTTGTGGSPTGSGGTTGSTTSTGGSPTGSGGAGGSLTGSGGAGGALTGSGGTGAGSTSSGSGGTGGGPPGCAILHPDMIEVPAPGGGTYCIDKTEVTNKAYAAWLATSPPIADQPPECAWNTTLTPSTGWPAINEDLPASYVDWCDAHAYCAGVGKRLCGHIGGGAAGYNEVLDAVKDQWYNACSLGGVNVYPYGGTYDKAACNGEDVVGKTVAAGSLATCAGGFNGLFDMSGNVWEWEDACNAVTGEADQCRRRGGSYTSGPLVLKCAVKGDDARSFAASYVGIRCCTD
jgi:hypothetical protein